MSNHQKMKLPQAVTCVFFCSIRVHLRSFAVIGKASFRLRLATARQVRRLLQENSGFWRAPKVQQLLFAAGVKSVILGL